MAPNADERLRDRDLGLRGDHPGSLMHLRSVRAGVMDQVRQRACSYIGLGGEDHVCHDIGGDRRVDVLLRRPGPGVDLVGGEHPDASGAELERERVDALYPQMCRERDEFRPPTR